MNVKERERDGQEDQSQSDGHAVTTTTPIIEMKYSPTPLMVKSHSFHVPSDYPNSSSQNLAGSHQCLESIEGQHCRCFHCFKKKHEPAESLSSQDILSRRQFFLSSAKLRASGRTSALLAGFTMVAMVELELGSTGSQIPPALLVVFAACTTILVTTHLLALMISTCILPHLEAARDLDSNQAILKSPHNTMWWYIEFAWASSTVFGIFLFLVEIALISWVKFYAYTVTASWLTTALVIPLLFIFIAFAINFYHKFINYIYNLSEADIKELENIKDKLEQRSSKGITNLAFIV